MSTTIFIPMPEWQALSFLRNRDEAFKRLLSPADRALPCEVVLTDEGLYGFKQRADAVSYGQRVYPEGYAMLRVVIGKLTVGSMALWRQMAGSTDEASGFSLWRITREGVVSLHQKCKANDCEVMVDQIFGPAGTEACLAGDCAPGGNCHEEPTLTPDGTTDAGQPRQACSC